MGCGSGARGGPPPEGFRGAKDRQGMVASLSFSCLKERDLLCLCVVVSVWSAEHAQDSERCPFLSLCLSVCCFAVCVFSSVTCFFIIQC